MDVSKRSLKISRPLLAARKHSALDSALSANDVESQRTCIPLQAEHPITSPTPSCVPITRRGRIEVWEELDRHRHGIMR